MLVYDPAVPTMQRDHVQTFLERVAREVADGHLPSCQVALGFEGEIVAHEVFGDAQIDDRYCVFSATKPFVASTVWTLLADGDITLDDKIADLVPGFGENGKGEVTLEQVISHPRAGLGGVLQGRGPLVQARHDVIEQALAHRRRGALR